MLTNLSIDFFLIQSMHCGDVEATKLRIIGGGIARAGAALFEPLEKIVREVEWNVGPAPVKILPAQLGEMAGAYGAAWRAMQ